MKKTVNMKYLSNAKDHRMVVGLPGSGKKGFTVKRN